MKKIVLVIQVLLSFYICPFATATTQHVTTSRAEAYGFIGPALTSSMIMTVDRVTFATSTGAVVNSSEGPRLRYTYEPQNTPAPISMKMAPVCKPEGPTIVSDSTGTYRVDCQIMVQRYRGGDFITYRSSGAWDIGAYAIDTIWSNDVSIVDPT